MVLTRRTFIQLAGVAALASGRAASGDARVRIGLVAPSGHSAAGAFGEGAALGYEEALQAGVPIELSEAYADSAAGAAAAGRRLAARGAAYVVGGLTGSYCEALSEAIPDRYLEVRLRQELTPGEAPIRHLSLNPGYRVHARTLVAGLRALGLQRFAVLRPNPVLTASARSAGLTEVQEAEAEILFADSDPLRADIVGPASPGYAVPVAWHDSLTRNGATELNARYRQRTGAGMDETAWYGWFAMKSIAGAVASGEPLAEAAVDGHKGAPLAYVDNRLKQPLYVVVTRPRSESGSAVPARGYSTSSGASSA